MLRHYVPLPKDRLHEIWRMQKELQGGVDTSDLGLAEDERVEDADLESDEAIALKPKTKEAKRVSA